MENVDRREEGCRDEGGGQGSRHVTYQGKHVTLLDVLLHRLEKHQHDLIGDASHAVISDVETLVERSRRLTAKSLDEVSHRSPERCRAHAHHRDAFLE